MQRISRREFVKRTAVTGAAFTSLPAILAACGTTSGGGGSNKPSKLVIAAVQGNEDGPLKKVAPKYKSETGIDIEIVEFPYPQLFEKLVTTFQANGSSYDLCMMDDPWMPKFGTMNALQPLDSNFGFTRDADIPAVVYDVGTWPPPHGPVPPTEQSKSKHLYGITIVGNVEMFMYRSDKSGAPKTWTEVLANAAKYNAANFYGYVIRGLATNPVSSDSLPILWSFGGNIFDDNWKVQLDSTASIDAVTFLTRSLKKYAQPGPESTDAADRSKLMATGKAYQSTVWPGEITGIVEDPTVSQVKGKVAYIPIPQGASGKGLGMMGNWLLGIPKGSKNGSAAADFIKWMIKTDNMRNYVAQGGIPIRSSILNDASLTSANPYFPALAQSFAAVPNWRPRTDQWNAVETIYGTQMNATIAGQITPQAAMQKAATDIRALMKGAGYPS
jgi:multiple sugar transport system substrate-binding protein